jgi:hypothetical protein
VKKIINRLFWILLVGTVFAWSNFFYELYLYMNSEVSAISCGNFQEGSALPNPFLTPCFYGAIMFALALTQIIVLKKQSSKK